MISPAKKKKFKLESSPPYTCTFLLLIYNLIISFINCAIGISIKKPEKKKKKKEKCVVNNFYCDVFITQFKNIK